MNIYACNYANDKFASQQKVNSYTAIKYGKVKHIFSYGPADLDAEFKLKNAHILNHKRGDGLWLWKPYIILKSLEQIPENDWLFYADSGSIYVNAVEKLVRGVANAHEKDIFLFELPLKNRQFCKREAYLHLNCEDHNENQLLGGFILLRNSERSRQFVREWLHYLEQEIFISPHRVTDAEEWPDFFSHREDQSVLSLLSYKWKLEVFRDPSDYGSRPYMHTYCDTIYSPKRYNNSPYPKILLSNKYHSPQKYIFRDFCLSIADFFAGFLLEKIFIKWRKVKRVEKS